MAAMSLPKQLAAGPIAALRDGDIVVFESGGVNFASSF